MEKKFLITAIDWSGSKKDSKNIYTLVSVEEKNYKKLKSYLERNLSTKHWKKLSKREKTIYNTKFLRKWEELKKYIYRSDIAFNIEDLIVKNYLILKNSKILVVDNSIIKYFPKEVTKIIIPENDTKIKKHYRPIILLSDNISNIFRKLYNETSNKKKRYELLKRFRK